MMLSFGQIGKDTNIGGEPEYIRDSDNDAIQHALMREDLTRLRKHIVAVQKYVGTVTEAK